MRDEWFRYLCLPRHRGPAWAAGDELMRAIYDLGGHRMATYRVVCTEQIPSGHPDQPAHIVAVGTGEGADKPALRWTLDQVLQAMDRGDLFYTKGVTSGKVALVEKYRCTPCGRTFTRSATDRVTDNNIDSLQRCSWKT
jgi:hypothetical protein